MICEGYRMGQKPASSQCNIRPCETRYSTIAAHSHQCGQILETLKGNTVKLCKLQIRFLVNAKAQPTFLQQPADASYLRKLQVER